MAHDHSHSHVHHHSSRNIGTAFFLNLIFCIVEFIGGLLTNSVAILSDAVHDLGDSISLGASWYFEHISRRKPTANFSYGYKRFSLIGALLNSIVLLVGSSFVILESVKRIITPQPVHPEGMLALAVLGVLINGVAVWKTSKGVGINERAVSLHMLEDVLGWVAVLLVSLIMMWRPFPILDPLLSISISLFVLWNVFRNLRQVVWVLLQAVPVEISSQEIKSSLEQMDGVVSVHDLHIWSQDSIHHVASLHVVIADSQQAEELKRRIRELLSTHSINHVTVEIERDSLIGQCPYCRDCSQIE